MKYTIARNGQTIGTYTLDELRGLLQSGQIQLADHALPEGGTQWTTVAQTITPPPPPPPPVPPVKPKNYMTQSVMVTVLCCLPLGIPAIVYSSQVNGKYASGDFAGAQAASSRANKFGIGAFVCGLIFAAIWAVMAPLQNKAMGKVRDSSQDKAVLNNARMLAAASDQFYLENGVSTVSIQKIVGPGTYIKQLTVVAGETYPPKFVQGMTITVTGIAGARTITYAP